MIALAFETTTDRLSVAGQDGPGGRVVSRAFEGARMHAARLFPLTEEVLHDLGAARTEVEALGVADGPGSFTGLRVGWAAAKALARARPAISVWTASTLLVRAAGAAPPRGARVLVVTPALRGELYAGSYRLDLPNTVETLMPPALASPESLHRETPDLLVADAPEKLVDRLADQFQVPLVRGAASQPGAAALLGLIGVSGGAVRLGSVDDREPTYGRPAEAQVRWEATHGRTLPDPSRGGR
ncbi:MAG TPA: tRNA (adenosine(37)-N6)-threonylcarbamoyltransferase complex dimerization subunit type 1 TsaB, partial [Gemmatimonadales bacterium]|nr:tRNA (adenosine(37)-N6)-threonylcarbamoyltransferase complex dimerization subunit type 1 TsaB [Gemmatimonadales bacterium]